MQLRYSFRIHPTIGQRVSLARAFGCARTVWNDALRLVQPVKAANKLLGNPRKRIAEGPYQRIPKSADLSKLLITEAKKAEERAWLADTSPVVLQQALRDFDKAWAAHEDSKSGKRTGPQIEEPRFKSRKNNRQAIRFTANARFSITGQDRLRLPKIGDVKVTWSRRLPSDPTSVTIIKDPAGRYWASFVVETEPQILRETLVDVGIDLGLTHFAILSDGRKIDSPKFLRRAEKKLKKAQRQHDRKAKGSNNRAKARVKVAKIHAHTANARRGFHHKLSTEIIGDNQAVYLETLTVRGLARTRMAKSVHDAGWSSFVSMLEYKAIKHGRTVIRVDRFFPSSQICADCGHRDGPKPLHVRTWTCTNCGTAHDRDVNAARAVKFEGRRIRAAQQHIPGDVPALTG
ncbi:RNA-guided endonuclease TnpB family protein [Kitasatospora sp. MAP5-34]|uniref:RNA-guided endonuclease InsQ/TnpB family protein n=1 Tax=Kitasatospora sp. MAP5-34 TaxID=3035102 RepID=UPI0024740AB2|nr:RNA-guided endonuclease TnpB family protein [Kitasatospora sp. MAP5-34]MDH6579477.1 putative transposase [Kitasatospora sp. MAP5-34]